MTRATFTITIALVCGTAVATPPPVTFESPCSCRDNHGQHRWSVKIDPSLRLRMQTRFKLSHLARYTVGRGLDVPLTQQSERTGIENNWYALTGRLVALKVEADGDLHIALQEATGDKPGIVVCEVPAKPRQTYGFTWKRLSQRYSQLDCRRSRAKHALEKSLPI
jgi:hypothetical protein